MNSKKDIVEKSPPIQDRPIYQRFIFGLIWIFITWLISQLLITAISMKNADTGGTIELSSELALYNFMVFNSEYGAYIEIGIILVCILLSVLGVLPGTAKIKNSNRTSTKISMAVLIIIISIPAVSIYFSLKQNSTIDAEPIPYFKFGYISRTAKSFDISPDGKTLILLNDKNKIIQFTLNTKWDLNSIVYANTYYSLKSNGEKFTSIKFSHDGKKLYVTKAGMPKVDSNYYNDGYLQQYLLANPFSLANVKHQEVDIDTKASHPMGVSFDETGEYMHVVTYIATLIRNYRLASPYDIATATYIGRTMISRVTGLGHLSLTKATEGIYYTIEGRSAYQFKIVLDYRDQYPELTYDNKYLRLHNTDASPVSILAHPKGNKVFVLTDDAKIYTYYLEMPFELDSEKI